MIDEFKIGDYAYTKSILAILESIYNRQKYINNRFNQTYFYLKWTF